MNKPDNSPQCATADVMATIAANASASADRLALADTEQKNVALNEAAAALRRTTPAILEANTRDITAAKDAGRPAAFVDRLSLSAERIDAIAGSLQKIAALADPVGETIAEWRVENGLKIERVRTPLGVIGVIYESRPNVTADAGALCLKAGNATILRGGSESYHSARAIHTALVAGLTAADLPPAAIQLVPTTDRAAVGAMLQGLDGAIDVIVPRGGKGLVERVQEEARVPVFAHLEGICHVYWDRGADPDDAVPIVVNAKMRRTGICGAAETLLIDQEAPTEHRVMAVQALLDAGCEVRGDTAIQRADPRVKPASEVDWSSEYLDAIISVKLVDGVDGAIRHIAKYGSDHTESILTECYGTAAHFLRHVNSAVVMHNASTQFSDGGEFGMGAEIGIATGKMHARGPVGVEQLTSFKYIVRGAGQIRPL